MITSERELVSDNVSRSPLSLAPPSRSLAPPCHSHSPPSLSFARSSSFNQQKEQKELAVRRADYDISAIRECRTCKFADDASNNNNTCLTHISLAHDPSLSLSLAPPSRLPSLSRSRPSLTLARSTLARASLSLSFSRSLAPSLSLSRGRGGRCQRSTRRRRNTQRRGGT
jgi:hypothetical protein